MSAWALALAAAVCSADDFSKFSDLEFAERYAFSTNRAALVSELAEKYKVRAECDGALVAKCDAQLVFEAVSNLVENKTVLAAPGITVNIKPSAADKVRTSVVDGRRCLLIDIDDPTIEINGLPVTLS